MESVDREDSKGKTGKKRGKMPEGKRFTKDKQPSSEAKKAGWDKRKTGQALVKQIFNLQFKGATNSPLLKMMAEYFVVDMDNITVETMMILRQIEKAVQKGDTNAFATLMNRIHGQPKQPLEVDATVKTSTLDVTKLPKEALLAIKAARKTNGS